jgi:hypothetical protein
MSEIVGTVASIGRSIPSVVRKIFDPLDITQKFADKVSPEVNALKNAASTPVMPLPKDEQARLAARRQQFELANRRGRQSTIMTAFSNDKLGV